MRTLPLLSLPLFIASLVAPAVAHADCAEPPSYFAAVEANTVVVCPLYATDGCPETGGMLRVDVATGAVAKLPTSCVPPPASLSQSEATACYQDECVPPGTYQYGYAEPFACAECGAESATVVTVTSALSGCVSDAGALEDAGSAPWDAAAASSGTVFNSACDHTAPQDAGAPDASKVVTARDAGVADASRIDSGRDAGTGAAKTTGSGSSGGGGCSTSPARSQHTVLAVDALVLALGLGALARRRTRRAG
jgi:MYXO-CTERM domain-containing protein